MSEIQDPRVAEARALSMRQIFDRLPIEGLKRTGAELVGPCPRCGGRDRFGVNLARGVFLCRVCGAAGDGIALAQHVLGCDFKGALEHLCGQARAIDPAELARRQAASAAAAARQELEAARYRAQAIEDARKIWARVGPATGGPVADYLAARGIRLASFPPALRALPDHPYVRKLRGQLVTLHRGPCMVAAIQGPDGKLSAVHQTWVDPDRPGHKAEICDRETGESFPAKIVRGSKKGGAIRLGGVPGSATLIMGEGIETTLSARIARPEAGIFWAGVDLGNISGRMRPGAPRGAPGPRYSGEPDPADREAFVPPPWVTRFLLIRDGDSAPEKTRAQLLSGFRRARLALPHLTGGLIDPGDGVDLNDILKGEQ